MRNLDIVDRLRMSVMTEEDLREAADEIEALRAQVKALLEVLEREEAKDE